MVGQADLSTCIQVTVFFPLGVCIASVILLAEADTTNTLFPAVQMLYFVTRSSEIIGIHLKHNYLYYNNTINQDIKHWCLFSKLAARMGAYFHGVLIDACNFPIATVGAN